MILWYFKDSPHSRYTQTQLTPSACRRRTNLPRSDRSAAEPPDASPKLLAPPAPQQTPRNHRWNEGLRRVRSTNRGFFHSNPGSGCDFHTWWANGPGITLGTSLLVHIPASVCAFPSPKEMMGQSIPGPSPQGYWISIPFLKGDQKMNQNDISSF